MSKKGTINILKTLKSKNKAQYKDLSTNDIGIAIATLNGRINQLLKSGIIEHHLKRAMKREEWYTLTKKGEKILSKIEEIEKIINSDQN